MKDLSYRVSQNKYWRLIINSLVPDDVHRRHSLSSFLMLMTSQDVQNSLVFLYGQGNQARKFTGAAGLNGLIEQKSMDKFSYFFLSE